MHTHTHTNHTSHKLFRQPIIGHLQLASPTSRTITFVAAERNLSKPFGILLRVPFPTGHRQNCTMCRCTESEFIPEALSSAPMWTDCRWWPQPLSAWPSMWMNLGLWKLSATMDELTTSPWNLVTWFCVSPAGQCVHGMYKSDDV